MSIGLEPCFSRYTCKTKLTPSITCALPLICQRNGSLWLGRLPDLVCHCSDARYRMNERTESEQRTWFGSKEKKRRGQRGKEERRGPETQGRKRERQKPVQILCGRVLQGEKSGEQLLCRGRRPISLNLRCCRAEGHR